MNLAKITSRRQRILQYLLFLGTTIAVVVGLAQTQGQSPDRFLIDGKLEPDRIPDFILWDRIFQMAVQLNETAPDHGEGIWIQKLHLPEEVMKEIVAQGFEYLEMLDDADKEAQAHISDSKNEKSDFKNHPNKTEALKSKLTEIQLNKEGRTLEMRDRLRERIGDEAFLRIESFARLQIAPNIKIGG